MKSSRKCHTVFDLNAYKDHRGVIVEKYRSFRGKYLVVMEEDRKRTRIQVGQGLFDRIQLGSIWTIGEMNGFLINIRPGICKDSEEVFP